MLGRNYKQAARSAVRGCLGLPRRAGVALEALEDRRLLSAWGFHAGKGVLGPGGIGAASIEFDQAPAKVQSGLDSLASTDGLAAPTTTQKVFLGNANGIESYTIDIAGTGTNTQLTVDQNGDPVTAPTRTTSTWGVLDGTGVGSNSKASAEITAIAMSLSLTAPNSTTVVHVTKYSSGASTYAVRLSPSSSSSTSTYTTPTVITVDSNGNPVGTQNLLFSDLPGAVKTGINNHLPAGASALTDSSTQKIKVETLDGVTVYTATFTVTGTTSTVTVNASGDLTSLPSSKTTTFSAIPVATQDELQKLATADNVSTTIGTQQSVIASAETNGTTIYSVTLSATGTGYDGNAYTYPIVLSVDEDGNPTTAPTSGGAGDGCGGGNGGGFGGWHGGDYGFGSFASAGGFSQSAFWVGFNGGGY